MQLKRGIENKAWQEFKDNWLLLLSASIGFSFFSMMQAGGGVFIQPLEEEFGWSRTIASSGSSISNFVTAILGFVAGMLIDKFGARKLVLPGIIVSMLIICSFSMVTGSVYQWFGLWLALGVAASTIKSTPWTAAVLGVFKQSRGLALGLVLAGTALAQIIVPPSAEFLIREFGWRTAFIALGLGWGTVTFALCFFFFFDAHDVAAKEKLADPDMAPRRLTGLSVQQAWRSAALWRLGISSIIVMCLTIGLTFHLMEILTDTGMSRPNAALLLSLSGVAGIVGKLVTGALLDKFRPNWVGGLTLTASAISFALLIDGVHNLPFIIFAMLVNGYTAGSKTQITGFLTGMYTGMKNFGTIYGFLAGIVAFAAAAGPTLAGKLYDMYGNYDVFLIIGAVGSVIGGLLLFSMPAYPDFEDEPSL